MFSISSSFSSQDSDFSDFLDLIKQCLFTDPSQRITAPQVSLFLYALILRFSSIHSLLAIILLFFLRLLLFFLLWFKQRNRSRVILFWNNNSSIQILFNLFPPCNSTYASFLVYSLVKKRLNWSNLFMIWPKNNSQSSLPNIINSVFNSKLLKFLLNLLLWPSTSG